MFVNAANDTHAFWGIEQRTLCDCCIPAHHTLQTLTRAAFTNVAGDSEALKAAVYTVPPEAVTSLPVSTVAYNAYISQVTNANLCKQKQPKVLSSMPFKRDLLLCQVSCQGARAGR